MQTLRIFSLMWFLLSKEPWKDPSSPPKSVALQSGHLVSQYCCACAEPLLSKMMKLSAIWGQLQGQSLWWKPHRQSRPTAVTRWISRTAKSFTALNTAHDFFGATRGKKKPDGQPRRPGKKEPTPVSAGREAEKHKRHFKAQAKSKRH